MKKNKFLYIGLFILFFLSSCWFNSQNDTQIIKDELLNPSSNNSSSENESWLDTFEENMSKFEEASNTEKEEKFYSISYETDQKFLSIDDLDLTRLNKKELDIKWKVLVDSVDKIMVKFLNIESIYPEDYYMLWKFKKGDNEFLYRAYDEYKTLDFGLNTYIIEAYSWDEVSIMKIEIKLSKKNEENILNKNENISVDLSSLPSSTFYGSASILWNWDIIYSDINWLLIRKVGDLNLDFTSDSVSEYVIENFESYPYWNTLRNIESDKWISFYLTRIIDENNYLYEKHYYTQNWYYWIIKLEEWSWISSENISDKNFELKESNKDFVITQISDILFKHLIDNN